MGYLINLYNQVGAGPRNISLNLISELSKISSIDRHYYLIVPDFEDYRVLKSQHGLTLIKLPRYDSILMKVLYRIYLDLVLMPKLVEKHSIRSVLAFGNFLLAPVSAKKTVLLHHPYLFDDRQLACLPLVARLVERIKRVAFSLTLRNVHQVVVQSEYVKGKLQTKWPWYHGDIYIIENPVSNRLGVYSDAYISSHISIRRSSIHEMVRLLYVSRFYPHKNHSFLLMLSQSLKERGLAHEILITIDSQIPGAMTLLDQIKVSGLPIVNLGEIDQRELPEHYLKAHALLFPSRSETFGNPLVEAMGFGLPVVAPDLEYTHAVLANSGVYYREDDAENCADRVLALLQDSGRYEAVSQGARAHFSKFLHAAEWWQKYLAMI